MKLTTILITTIVKMYVPTATKTEKSFRDTLKQRRFIMSISFSLSCKHSLQEFCEMWGGIPQVYTNYAKQPGEDVAGCPPKNTTPPVPSPTPKATSGHRSSGTKLRLLCSLTVNQKVCISP